MAETNEKVSVIIPTYNRAELLVKAVKSLQKQTHQNLEIIIIDDCSNDSTAQAVDCINDSRIIYIKHEVNKGGAEARNTGLQYASGGYIAFLDSDDQWMPDKLERQLALFEGNPAVGVIYTGMKVFQDGYLVREIIPKHKGDLLAKLVESNCIYTTSSILVKKELLEEIEGFNSSLPSCQDWDLYLRLAQISQFDFVEDSLVLYMQHSGDRISTNHKAVVDGHMQIYETYKEIAQAQGKEVFQKFSIKIARTIFRMGLISQDKKTVNLSRWILVTGLAKTRSTSKNIFLYSSTYMNLKFLRTLHTQYERFNTGYYAFPIKKSSKLKLTEEK